MKDLHCWNSACILKLIWMLFFRSDSVWVNWFKEVILKGDLSNYWSIRSSTSFSWLVNKMIKERDTLFPLVKRCIENGRSTSFWFDNWTPFGKLYDHLSANVSWLGIPKTVTVASLYSNGTWLLPPARSDKQLDLQIQLTTIQLSEMDDYYN